MLRINASKQLFGDLHFNSCQINYAHLSGNNYNSNIIFNQVLFKKLSLEYFNNFSTLLLISVKALQPKSELSIYHSNLGKTHLYNIFLDTFHQVKIYNSILTDIIVANVKWFDDKHLNPTTANSSEEFTYKKEIYRQIKFALEKQGDRISSLKFKALEMKAFKMETFAKIVWYKKIFNKERFILWVGQTNNFGQNWMKPALFAIISTVIFYFLIVVGISEYLCYTLNLTTESILTTFDEFLKYSNILPQLMNPANSLSKILSEEIKPNFITNFWQFCLKICLTFFIFQTISAFRKYMK